jgi:hypothetical protein
VTPSALAIHVAQNTHLKRRFGWLQETGLAVGAACRQIEAPSRGEGRVSIPRLRIVAKAFPTSDAVFRERVREIATTLDPPTPEAAVAEFEARLRSVHPTAAVHLRGDLATLDGVTTMYVFRDGTVGAKESAED